MPYLTAQLEPLQKALDDLYQPRLQVDLVHLMTRPLDHPELHPHPSLSVLVGGPLPSVELRSRGRLGKRETVVFPGKEEQERGVRGELAERLGEGSVGWLRRR